VTSLEGWGSTVELHPRGVGMYATRVAYRLSGALRGAAIGFERRRRVVVAWLLG
jgi:hypothetical protein